jgi:hypothetical protein
MSLEKREPTAGVTTGGVSTASLRNMAGLPEVRTRIRL